MDWWRLSEFGIVLEAGASCGIQLAWCICVVCCLFLRLCVCANARQNFVNANEIHRMMYIVHYLHDVDIYCALQGSCNAIALLERLTANTVSRCIYVTTDSVCVCICVYIWWICDECAHKQYAYLMALRFVCAFAVRRPAGHTKTQQSQKWVALAKRPCGSASLCVCVRCVLFSPFRQVHNSVLCTRIWFTSDTKCSDIDSPLFPSILHL